MEKSVLDLATRTVQDLLVALLNEGNKEVLDAHERASSLDQMPLPYTPPPLSTSTPPLPLPRSSPPASPTGPRRRKAPEKYGQYDMTINESTEDPKDNDFYSDVDPSDEELIEAEADLYAEMMKRYGESLSAKRTLTYSNC